MAHYAEIDENNIVLRVIVVHNNEEPTEEAGREFCQNLLGGTWIKTSYNTRGGVHYDQDGQPDSGIALRKNYAGIGYTYDPDRNAFIPPKSFASWALDEETCLWNPPIAMPADGKPYLWNEETTSWVELT